MDLKPRRRYTELTESEKAVVVDGMIALEELVWGPAYRSHEWVPVFDDRGYDTKCRHCNITPLDFYAADEVKWCVRQLPGS